MVFMKLQLYVHASVTPRSNKKLSFKYYGPFKVLEHIGEVAYRLELPEACKIHPVLHVSQLKKQVPKGIDVSDFLSSVCTNLLPPSSTYLHRSRCRAPARASQQRPRLRCRVAVPGPVYNDAAADLAPLSPVKALGARRPWRPHTHVAPSRGTPDPPLELQCRTLARTAPPPLLRRP